MQVRTRHTPVFGVARVGLAPGESVRVGAGTMLASSYGVSVAAQPEGGLLSSLARTALGEQPVAVCTYTATPERDGWVDIAPAVPGDLQVIELAEETGWCLRRDSWLVCETTVRLRSRWEGFRELSDVEPGCLIHAVGPGLVVLCCCGAPDVLTLEADDYITLDPGFLVGYPDVMRVRSRRLGLTAGHSARSGDSLDRLVLDVAGPGQVLVQTRRSAREDAGRG